MTRPALAAVTLAALVLAACNNPRELPITGGGGPPAARFTMTLERGATLVLAPGEVAEPFLRITRDPGFDGPVTFSVEPPPGVLVVFRPETILGADFAEMRVVVAQSAERTSHQIRLVGRATDGAETATILALTVRDPSAVR